MDTRSPIPTLIAAEIDYYDSAQIIEWAEKEVPQMEWHSDNEILIELVSLNAKRRDSLEQAKPVLKRFINSIWPEFDIKSPKATMYAKMWFRKRLEDYVNDRCEPWALCRMVGPIEKIYDFPKWIGNLYNACDWVEPDTQTASCPHLIDEARAVLSGLTRQ
ncbi:MAG: hypothetical protein PF961_13130 [Planctomycetota bacterium]|jgi:hypothetical protein|nr:hypothetical protein [Planctomycetota bacterium]